jgi:hypothetical protein
MTTSMVELANVVSVYSGKDGKCCCGCAGKHYDAKENAKQVKRIVNLINANAALATQEDDHTFVVLGSRVYIAYTR